MLHVTGLWGVYALVDEYLLVPEPDKTLHATLDDTEPLDFQEEDEDEPEPLEEPEEPEMILPEVVLPEEVPVQDTLPQMDTRQDVLGVGAAGSVGGARGGRARGWSVPDALSSTEGEGSPFRRYVEDLRARGLDVVIVLDATGSMQRFIDRARDTLDEIIADLAVVVPTLRLGIVAYRDTGDEWVTRTLDLSADRYRIHDFLYRLEASGGRRVGADFEEAVEVGLEVACDGSSWRPEARRVVLLVGDAPYHAEDQSAALATVRSFARDRRALVNTLYVGRMSDPLTENQEKALDAWDRIADTGDGVAFQLQVDEPGADLELRRQVSRATFGDEWAEEIAALQSAAVRDGRADSVRRHVTRKDRLWLLRRMRNDPLHPAVPAGCIELFDGRIAVAMVNQFEDDDLPPDVRSAALYVLRRSIAQVRDLPLDVDVPLAEQKDVLAALRHDVRQVPGAQRFLDGADPMKADPRPPPRGRPANTPAAGG